MRALRIALSVLLAAVVMLVPAPAFAVSDCQAWDGVGGTTDILHTSDGTVETGGAATLLGIRFKALGTSPVFTGMEYATPAAGTFSFYIHNWQGSLIAYRQGVYIADAGANYIPFDSGVSLTQDNEYIASVYIYPWYTVYYNVPILYPSSTSRMSATSGNAWYYSNLSGWPNSLSWTNANPAAGNNWTFTPVVCQA